jgi:hypothetical protein
VIGRFVRWPIAQQTGEFVEGRNLTMRGIREDSALMDRGARMSDRSGGIGRSLAIATYVAGLKRRDTVEPAEHQSLSERFLRNLSRERCRNCDRSFNFTP